MNGWSVYWLCWFCGAFFAFLIPEVYALAAGHDENTLSAQIWHLESLTPGQHIWQWSAAHWLIGGMLAVTLVWLIGHFLFGIWH
jgi:hypothetical protein